MRIEEMLQMPEHKAGAIGTDAVDQLAKENRLGEAMVAEMSAAWKGVCLVAKAIKLHQLKSDSIPTRQTVVAYAPVIAMTTSNLGIPQDPPGIEQSVMKYIDAAIREHYLGEVGSMIMLTAMGAETASKAIKAEAYRS